MGLPAAAEAAGEAALVGTAVESRVEAAVGSLGSLEASGMVVEPVESHIVVVAAAEVGKVEDSARHSERTELQDLVGVGSE